ncbi:flagellar basal body-associated FliL family protein [Marinomonas mediterranea]|jgi:Flagellar basal body-associated protein|uniref:Flagellar protein FliL n=1 Tax=Marinomonas mediterranea (strain ATCC 700492 / JCM 21426 / NBRC 103028 / MMB-1) TaxID=717774 RepID=F2K3K4_MARM1|nr:flagellar basal body-associated FliL family protein [Marinomonas mediterranea]ADZ92443.1 flagellar basal body-associated protein FliL [Marinomonas mediterranea MMB-1]WCN18493.1 flagellar protein [Marinomonas mediterranea MMB-1]
MADEDNLDVSAEDGKKGGKKKLIIILVAVLILLGGGGAAAYLFLFSGDEPLPEESSVDDAAAQAVQTDGPAIYLELDQPFVVDFMVSGRQRYLQLKMTLKSRDQVQIDAVKIHMPLIRNSLVLLFSSQSFDELQTLEGKKALKQAALESVNNILTQETGVGGMQDVLFTNFVMQ